MEYIPLSLFQRAKPLASLDCCDCVGESESNAGVSYARASARESNERNESEISKHRCAHDRCSCLPPTTSLPTPTALSQQRRCSGFAVDLRSQCERQKQLRRSSPSKHYIQHAALLQSKQSVIFVCN